MPKERSSKKVPSALDRLGLQPDPQALLGLNLETYEQLFREDPNTTYAAFMALSSVAAHYWQLETDVPARVEVPWWALDAVANSFQVYLEAREDGRITSFGEAFGMEVGGQGKRPVLTKIRKMQRDRDVALHVALNTEEGQSVEKAVTGAAQRCSLSEPTVWRIWRKWGERAKATLANFRTINSSGSYERKIGD